MVAHGGSASISAARRLALREPPAAEGRCMASMTAPHVEAASTLAVVASSNEPLLFLAADLTVIAASASFCRAFQIDPASVPGRSLSDLGAGEWSLPQLGSLLKATASGSAQIEAYEIDLVRKGHPPRSLVLNARKLEDGDEDRVRLLLAITDVTLARTEARQKDDLIREKAVLLQEVQHNEIGPRHQWRVQDRRHARDDDPTRETREHEDVDADEGGDVDREVHRICFLGLRPLFPGPHARPSRPRRRLQ
jgi:PAS domain-containing protein